MRRFCIPVTILSLVFSGLIQSPIGAYSVVETISVTGPKGIAINPSNTRAYIADDTNDRVHVIDLSTKASIATVPVGDAPNTVVVNPSGTKVYVTNYISGTVSVIDTATNTVSATIAVGQYPIGITINPAGTFAYVANSGSVSNSIWKIDLATNLAVYTISVANTPYKIAIDPTGSFAYVTRFDGGKVSIIDLSTDRVVDPLITVGSGPRGIAVSPTGTVALVSNGDAGTVSVIDLATKAVIGSPITVGSDPDAIVFNSTGTFAYVANGSSQTVSEINLATKAVTKTINVGNTPLGIAIDSTDTNLYITNYYGNSLMIARVVSSNPTSASTSSESSPSVVVKIDNNLEKSMRFSRGSSTLTKAHEGILKKSVETSGIEATYVVTGTAGLLPGVTDAQVKVLANLRANLIKDYLTKLGVNKANISIEIKITNQGIIPKTKTLANYLTS